jgi:hypothetical protein
VIIGPFPAILYRNSERKVPIEKGAGKTMILILLKKSGQGTAITGSHGAQSNRNTYKMHH